MGTNFTGKIVESRHSFFLKKQTNDVYTKQKQNKKLIMIKKIGIVSARIHSSTIIGNCQKNNQKKKTRKNQSSRNISIELSQNFVGWRKNLSHINTTSIQKEISKPKTKTKLPFVYVITNLNRNKKRFLLFQQQSKKCNRKKFFKKNP